MITTAQLDTFVSLVSDKIAAYNAKTGFPFAVKIEYEIGKKYARIVKSDVSSRSAFCFIDLATGDILKSASWKTPAKGIRGNIKNGAENVGPYGAVYLR